MGLVAFGSVNNNYVVISSCFIMKMELDRKDMRKELRRLVERSHNRREGSGRDSENPESKPKNSLREALAVLPGHNHWLKAM